jgi:hypothetical protein
LRLRCFMWFLAKSLGLRAEMFISESVCVKNRKVCQGYNPWLTGPAILGEYRNGAEGSDSERSTV